MTVGGGIHKGPNSPLIYVPQAKRGSGGVIKGYTRGNPDMTKLISSTHFNGGTPKLALKLKETADCMSVSQMTIRRFVGRGLLHPVRAGRHLLFTVEEIRRFLNISNQN